MTMTLISTVTVGAGGAASINFTSIPQTYTDLSILISVRSTNATSPVDVMMSFNAGGSTMPVKVLQGSGTAATSFGDTNYGTSGYTQGSNYTANTFSSGSIYIPNYTASINKTISAESVTENNASASWQAITALSWTSTAAIASITFTTTGNFAQYSTASLYGILKGSGGATVS